MFFLCFLHFFRHLILLLHHSFIISFFEYLCFKFIKAFEYLIVQEANLCLDLLDVETLGELFSNVFSYLLNHLWVHAIVVCFGIIQTAIIYTYFHSIVYEEGIFVGVVQKEGRVVKSFRNRLSEMRQPLLYVSNDELLIFYVIAICLHFSLHVLDKIAEFSEHKRNPEVFHWSKKFFHIFELYQVNGPLSKIYNKHGQNFIPSSLNVQHHFPQTNSVFDPRHVDDGDVFLLQYQVLRDRHHQLDPLYWVDIILVLVCNLQGGELSDTLD